jgi:hypothetical protein
MENKKYILREPLEAEINDDELNNDSWMTVIMEPQCIDMSMKHFNEQFKEFNIKDERQYLRLIMREMIGEIIAFGIVVDDIYEYIDSKIDLILALNQKKTK